MVTHMIDKLVLSSVLHHTDLSVGFLKGPPNTGAGFLRANDSRERKCLLWHRLRVTHHHFHNVQRLQRSALFSVGADNLRSWTGDKEYGGHLRGWLTQSTPAVPNNSLPSHMQNTLTTAQCPQIPHHYSSIAKSRVSPFNEVRCFRFNSSWRENLRMKYTSCLSLHPQSTRVGHHNVGKDNVIDTPIQVRRGKRG